jgi:CubicO group peptidase (beta-lactamase class C family)
LIGCKNEVQIAQLQYPVYNDTIPHIKPFLSEIEPIDDLEFANSKNHLINFANKNWSEKNNVSFLVAKNGQIIFENYQGFSNYETKTQITAQTPMHIASVSKVITATAIMILVDSGRISLDQKVSSILQSFPYVDVSVRDLLAHRSGMRNYAYFTEEKGVWNRQNILRNNDILTLLSTKKNQTRLSRKSQIYLLQHQLCNSGFDC